MFTAKNIPGLSKSVQQNLNDDTITAQDKDIEMIINEVYNIPSIHPSNILETEGTNTTYENLF